MKAKLYARRGIAEYWLVDLTRAVVVVYREPVSSGASVSYQWSSDFGKDESIASSAVENLSIETNFLLELAQ